MDYLSFMSLFTCPYACSLERFVSIARSIPPVGGYFAHPNTSTAGDNFTLPQAKKKAIQEKVVFEVLSLV